MERSIGGKVSKPKKMAPPKGIPPRIWKLALEVFGEDRKVRSWFGQRNRALGWKTPRAVIKAGGAKEIENIFGRIAHGVFS